MYEKLIDAPINKHDIKDVVTKITKICLNQGEGLAESVEGEIN